MSNKNLLITKSGTIHLGDGDIAVGNVLTEGATLLPVKWELKKKTRVFKLLSKIGVI